jgi:hypothetical protein
MKFNSLYLVFALALTLSFTACKKDEENKPAPTTPVTPTGSLEIEFEHKVGSLPLKLDSAEYTNTEGETFSVSMFNYYISNIKLKKTDGTEYVVPQNDSYFLIVEQKPSTKKIKLNNIPEGNYNGITFMIGVDSLRSVSASSERIGVLDIIDTRKTFDQKMYWAWNSGYIFVKLEGESPQAPEVSGKRMFKYHIGGFGGFSTPTLNNIRTVTQTLSSGSAMVKSGKTPSFHFEVDLLKVFGDGISIKNHSTIMSTTSISDKVANNYVRMFHLDHAHN